MKSFLTILAMLLCSIPMVAQAKPPGTGSHVSTSGSSSININASNISSVASEGNTASVTVGGIGDNVDVQGVSVINGKVWIDGKEIPAGVKRYKTKEGTVYRIDRAKDGSVSVNTE